MFFLESKEEIVSGDNDKDNSHVVKDIHSMRSIGLFYLIVPLKEGMWCS